MAGRLRGFFKIPQHDRFEYKPVFYNKRKEELREKINTYKEKKKLVDNGDYKPNFKGKFSNSFEKTRKKQNKTANIRLIGIIIFLGIITYIILQKLELLSYMFEILLSGGK
jgi:hypothetical protein